AGNDQAGLTKLTIDQPEFKKYLWPALAMNMSTSNMSADKYYPTYQKAKQSGIAEGSIILAGEKGPGGEGGSSTSSTQGQGLPGPRPTAGYNARRERAGEERQAGRGTSGAGWSLQGDHLLRDPLPASRRVDPAHTVNSARGLACRSHSTLPTSMGCDQAQSLAHEKRRGIP